jgi:hypothetical protein
MGRAGRQPPAQDLRSRAQNDLHGGEVNGFDEMVIEARGPRPHTVGLLAVAGERDQPQFVDARNLAETLRQIIAVHHRKADIDEGHIRAGRRLRISRDLAETIGLAANTTTREVVSVQTTSVPPTSPCSSNTGE